MDAKEKLHEYLDLTKDTMKPNTWDTHRRFTRHILNGLRLFNVTKLEDIDANVGYMLVGYYKNYTTNSNNSINKNLRYLKAVLRHYEIATSFQKFGMLKSDTKPFKKFTHEELKTIINYVRDMELSKNSQVYRTYVMLALDSGMRKSELLNVKNKNIDFKKKQIYLEVTKNGEHRFAPFSSFSEEEIKKLMEKRTHRKYLFFNKMRNRQLTKNDIKLFYRRMRKATDINSIHTHRFRKTFASTLAENGMPIQYIQKLLDHDDIATTMLYIDYDDLKPLEEYKQYNNWHIDK